MIAGVNIEVDGRAYSLRMTTRAMMSIEDHFDKSIPDVLSDMEENPCIGTIVVILRECMANGDGVEMKVAQDFVDAIGFSRAGELLSDTASAAFPEASEKNVKRAGRKK